MIEYESVDPAVIYEMLNQSAEGHRHLKLFPAHGNDALNKTRPTFGRFFCSAPAERGGYFGATCSFSS